MVYEDDANETPACHFDEEINMYAAFIEISGSIGNSVGEEGGASVSR